jgi:hypothetical protein
LVIDKKIFAGGTSLDGWWVAGLAGTIAAMVREPPANVGSVLQFVGVHALACFQFVGKYG